MKIAEFFQKTIDGELCLDEQKQYLLDNPFPPAEEIAEAVKYLYTQMAETPDLPGAIDICGTGGSGLSRPNVSTISAFIAAGAGVKVAKHGNNAASGKFGSFDLLEVLGIPINLSPSQLQLRFNEYNLAFLYAKSFHPIMRFFAPVRAQVGRPTFFNILGPLLSPVRAQRQLIGTPKIEYAKIIAEVCRLLDKERVIVVVGSDGLDEVTLCGPTHILELNDGGIKEYDLNPSDFGVESAKDFSEISVEDPEQNVPIARSILESKEGTKKTELVLVNTALALHLADKSDDLKQCYQQARQALDTGKALKVLDNYRAPDVLVKMAERDKDRDFGFTNRVSRQPRKYKGGLIAEIKRASPSEGDIAADIDVAAQTKLYESSGASAISVLSEPTDFAGSFDDLEKVRGAVNLPILCKDFIYRKEHIDKAEASGADMVLLIAAALSGSELRSLHDHATSRGLQPVMEVHNQAELEKVLPLKPETVGVNARDLHDFSIHPEVFDDLFKAIPKGVIRIAESGINSYGDIPGGYNGVLVGTSLMKHPFPGLKAKELSGQPLMKFCGIRKVEDAELCEKLGVDMIGINLVPRSKRKVDTYLARQIAEACKNTIPVGIFEDQRPDEVNRLARESRVKAIQLSGQEKDLTAYELPIIKTIRFGEKKPAQAFMSILDGPVAGSGRRIDPKQINRFEPSLIAGGVNLDVAKEIIVSKNPLGIDTASGIETDRVVDQDKIRSIHRVISSIRYPS